MTNKLVLYDLPSKGRCACWSLNPWKTRLALNYKGISYETQWLEYPDIAPTFSAAGLAPNTTGPAAYTIPTIRLPDGTLIQDSATIAPALELLYPNPPLRFSHSITDQVQELVLQAINTLRPIWVPKIPRNVLNPRSVQYFEETRAVRHGMSLEQLEQSVDPKTLWAGAEPSIAELAGLLKVHPEGPFFLGQDVCYADFVFVAVLQCLRRADKAAFEKFVAFDQEGFGGLLRACEKWLVRDDH